MSRISQAQRYKRFGAPGQRANMRWMRTPWTDPLDGDHVYVWVHELVVEPLMHAMAHAVRPAWTPQRIDSLAVRKIRGSTTWSLHSWALAWDFFATPRNVPPPGGVWKPDDHVTAAFAEPFEDHGFTWGRRWKREDWPHIEWAGLPP